MDPSAAAGYRSRAQIARVVTEHWSGHNLYCPACPSNRLIPTPANTQAVDFRCASCDSPFQLKSGNCWNERRIPDAGYDAMMRAIYSDRVPNLFVMSYSREWTVENLLVVPSFFFSPSAIEKRKPLSPNARRAGWVGCNILLKAIPREGKVRLVEGGGVRSSVEVRDEFSRLKALASLHVAARGWTIDVLRCVRSIGLQSFELRDVYAFEAELRALHPKNQHVRDKIRQQLQVLRDLGIVEFGGRGRYRIK